MLEQGHTGIEIQVLGQGCPRCNQLEQDLMDLIAEMKIDVDLEHVRDLAEIGRYGAMGSPALVVNGGVKAVGVVPPKAKQKVLIEQTVNQPKS